MRLNSRRFKSLTALLLLFLLFACAPLSFACGPFTLSAVFTFSVHPEYPLERYAKGELGVVQPTYARSYLYAAYRHLEGVGFNQQEQESLVSLWQQRLDYRWTDEGKEGTQVWLEARKKVANVDAVNEIEVFRSREKPNEYEQYLNCPNDAFQNAAASLNLRIEKFGADNPILKEWVTAQDTVFSNCSSGKQVPQPATAEADPLIRYDRAYQIAAANFYAGDFAEARNLFTSIAADKNSQWRPSAPYLLARTYVREASIGAPERRDEAHAAAEKELNTILSNPALAEWHAAAKRLLNIVLLRHRPQERLHQLATELLEKNSSSLKQDLWDYTVLLDQFLEDESEEKKDPPPQVRDDSLTDWIITFQDDRPTAAQYAREQWQARHSLPWLVAALSKASATDSQINELLASADKVLPASPAFATISFHVVRLMMASSRIQEARRRLDDLLQKHRSRFNISGTNQLESQRMTVASDLQDFLKHAQRVPAAFSWDDDGREIPAEESEISDESKSFQGKTLLDADAAQLLNQTFPLELWSEAAASNVLAPHLRRDVVQAAFLRAVLLGDAKTAEQLVPTLRSQIPELGSFLDAYLASKQPEARKFSAVYMWLKFPGLEPIVDTGILRQSGLAEQDSYRDNWWCSAAFPSQARSVSVPVFMTAQQRVAGEAEAARLQAMGAGPNLLARAVIDWANKKPSDPRVPEALHLAVRSTRFGCTDKDTARWSKAAFDLLRKRYPRSAWTKRTPYWFKD